MRTQKTLDFSTESKHVVALGCFDGVHLGHASLIRAAKEISLQSRCPLAVFCFEEPPRNFFAKQEIPILTPPNEKKRLLKNLGTDLLISVRFNEKIASLEAEQFFEQVLIERLHASHIVCGFNYRFGKNGSGDIAMLKVLCKKIGIELSVLPPVTLDGVAVSSSEIRRLLSEGDIKQANRLLCRPYSIRAEVINGQHLGRTLGFPTVNQLFPKNSTPLKNGVYVTRVRIGRGVKRAITNVGVRPTVDGSTLCAETNIFDFDGDLYGKLLRVEFLDFIRPEQKFNSIDELRARVLADIELAKSK